VSLAMPLPSMLDHLVRLPTTPPPPHHKYTHTHTWHRPLGLQGAACKKLRHECTHPLPPPLFLTVRREGWLPPARWCGS
jgi:hypothetical protein